jgi:hypothetical protein
VQLLFLAKCFILTPVDSLCKSSRKVRAKKTPNSGVIVDRKRMAAKLLHPANEDWDCTISEFLTSGGQPPCVEGTLYDPKIRRYFKRDSDGCKIIVG